MYRIISFFSNYATKSHIYDPKKPISLKPIGKYIKTHFHRNQFTITVKTLY